MNRLLVSAAVLGLISTTPAFAQAGPGDSATAPAVAEIVQAISVTSDESSLSFGQIAAPVDVAGTVSVDASGNLTPSDPSLLITGTTGSAAGFNVQGGPGLAYTPSVSTPVTLSSGVNEMTADVNTTGNAASLNGSGSDTFQVVGTLNVGTNQPAGVYNGTVNVSVVYD